MATDASNPERPESLAGAPVGPQRRPVGESAAVSISAITSLGRLDEVVDSLARSGVSATVRLRGGLKEDIRSSILRLATRREVVSAALTLRGDKPAG